MVFLSAMVCIALVAGVDGRVTGNARSDICETRGDGETTGRNISSFTILACLAQPRLNAAHSVGCSLSSSNDAMVTCVAVFTLSIVYISMILWSGVISSVVDFISAIVWSFAVDIRIDKGGVKYVNLRPG